MSVSIRLDLRQSQSLVMTPQLQQAIKLLQLGNLELATYVQQELEQNPFLERQEEPDDVVKETSSTVSGDDGSAVLSGTPDFVTEDGASGDGWSGSGEDGWAETEKNTPIAGFDVEHVADGFAYVGRGGTMAFDEAGDSLEDRASRAKTLQEHLIEQMLLDIPDGPERLIAYHLIEMVDESGYLKGELCDVVARLACEESLVEEVLARLHRFDPPGIRQRMPGSPAA